MKFQSLMFTMLVAVLSFGQVPTITSFSPTSGPVGTTVTITGTNFSTTAANNSVFFGGAKAVITSASATEIQVTVPSGATHSEITVFNGILQVESKLKFYTTNASTSAYPLASNTFATAIALNGTATSSSLHRSAEVIADVDLDGKMDVLKATSRPGNSGGSNFSAYKNVYTTGSISSSSFNNAINYPIGINYQRYSSLESVDINNDGYLDMVGGDTYSGNGAYFLNSTSTFGFGTVNSTGVVGNISTGDFNLDGKIDLLSSDYSGNLKISLNTGNAFGTAVSTGVSLSDYLNWFTIADLDLDGKCDVIGYNGTNLILVKNNYSTGTLSSSNFVSSTVAVTGSTSFTSVNTADLDNDGDLDIILVGSDSKIFVIPNSSTIGAFNFTGTQLTFSFPGTVGTNNAHRFGIGDLNGDGKLDLAIPNYITNGTGFIVLFENNSNSSISFKSPIAHTVAANVFLNTCSIGDVNQDNKPDIVAGSPYYSVYVMQNQIAPPPISATPNSLSGFTACQGSASAEQSTSISGTNLGSNNITVTAPTGYEVSLTSGSNFGSSITLNQSGGSVAATNVYVRLSSTASAGNVTGNLVATDGTNPVNIALSGTVNALPTLTTQPFTTAVVKCYGSAADIVTVATSASSPSYQWQQSITAGGTFANVTTGSNGTTAAFTPSHPNIWSSGKTMYYRCLVTSNGCTTTSNVSASYKVTELTQTAQPSTVAQNVCINGSTTTLTVGADNTGLPITYTWQSSTTSNGSYSTAVGNTGTNTFTPPSSTAGTLYYRCYYNFCGGLSQASSPSGAITVTDTYTWTGATSTDPTVAGNWNPAAVPCSGANEVIPSGLTNYPAYTNLTIDAGTTLTVQTGGRLTVTGTLTNNGTLTIESGATFLQGSFLSGSGTYNVKQFVTGAGGATPTGRFWYMGLPINNLTRATAFGTASGSNRLWSWSESGQVWSSQITDATALSPTTGYVFRTGADVTLNFSGTSLYSANPTISGLTNSGGSFDGCHLMSNPYTAYLDWEQVIAAAGTTNLSSTYCVRSFNSTNSEMVYDTYNATGDVSVNPSGVAMTQYIAPMQSFWITVNPSTTGTLSMTKAMLSHQAGAVGLKDITSFPAFARLNLVSGNFYDQVVVYTDANANAELEDYDSKKFFLPNKAQVYCPVGNEKLVINALKQGKAQTSAPLTVELPSTQVYKFEMAESFVENGLVILEDKQEGIFQDMGVNPIYEFFGNSGVIADRFVLHFQLPNGTNNEGQAGIEDLTSGQIAVIANHDGAITVALSADLTTSGDVQIFDEAGRLVAQKAITSAQTSLQLSNGMGVYFVRVQTPMKTEMKKVMVY